MGKNLRVSREKGGRGAGGVGGGAPRRWGRVGCPVSVYQTKRKPDSILRGVLACELIWPNAEFVGFVCGPPNVTRLVRLNASTRNWKYFRSANLKLLLSDASNCFTGCRRRL